MQNQIKFLDVDFLKSNETLKDSFQYGEESGIIKSEGTKIFT